MDDYSRLQLADFQFQLVDFQCQDSVVPLHVVGDLKFNPNYVHFPLIQEFTRFTRRFLQYQNKSIISSYNIKLDRSYTIKLIEYWSGYEP